MSAVRSSAHASLASYEPCRRATFEPRSSSCARWAEEVGRAMSTVDLILE
jgi:hypothetical protein